MRWVHHTLYPLIAPLLHPRQFGDKQGCSPAHATHAFLHDVDKLVDVEAILAFDVYHAFDSPPKLLIRTALDRLGTPLKLLRIISLAQTMCPETPIELDTPEQYKHHITKLQLHLCANSRGLVV